MNVQKNNAQADQVTLLMKDVLTVRVRDRAARFAAFHQAIVPFLSALKSETGPVARPVDPVARERFQRQAEIYLCALSSYPTTSEAWKDVFVAFKKMFELYVYGKVQNDAPKTMASDPLKPNPDLATHWRIS